MKQTANVIGTSQPEAPRRAVRLHSAVARDVGLAILTGRLRPGEVLEGEIEASERREVSRTVYREALKILSAKGLLHSRPRTGTRVSRVEDWHLLDPDVLTWLFSESPSPAILHGLFELRSIVEPAAAALAAQRRQRSHLERMQRALDDMARHTLKVPEGRKADREFHAELLASTANPFVISMINGVTAAVDSLTEYKLRLARIDRDPVPDHLRVYDAIAAKDADAARDAMIRLIRLAILDVPSQQRPRADTSRRDDTRESPEDRAARTARATDKNRARASSRTVRGHARTTTDEGE